MSTLMDKLVEVKNEAAKSIEEQHPYIWKKLTDKISNIKWGVQILDSHDKVLEEYTLIVEDGKIFRYEKGIEEVILTCGINKSFLEKTLLEIGNKYSNSTHPILTYLSYLPKNSLAILRGDIKFGKR